MKKSSFLIRFIDVGLIILFGFIIISDITVRSQIELPGSDVVESQEQRDLSLYIIGILPNNQYQISDFIDSSILGVYDTVESFESALRQLKSLSDSQDKSIVALIEPYDTITMQRLINVMDICDKAGIPKNINVESMRL